MADRDEECGARDAALVAILEHFDDVAHRKTDVFRERVAYDPAIKARLAQARREGAAAVAAAAAELGDARALDPAVQVDLLLSLRAVSDWGGMIALVVGMSPWLAQTLLVREQYAFALNRAGRGEEAEGVLRALIAARGASSETCALLGRVYKDRWEAALKAGEAQRARSALDQAIATYRAGFEADARDALPGINALTLMTLRDAADTEIALLLPRVRAAVEANMARVAPDYWDHATLIELAVIARDEAAARQALAAALAALREPWEAQTTARNLRLLREARAAQGETLAWAEAIESALDAASPAQAGAQ